MPSIPSAVHAFKEAVQDLYGNRLVEVVLYGSHAREEAWEGSDIDIMVVLRGDVDPSREVRRMVPLVTDVSLEHDAVLSVFPVSEDTYQHHDSGFLRNVRREAVQVRARRSRRT